MGLYVQDGYPTTKLRLSDNEYKRAMQSLVKYCHDVIVIGPDNKFYLPFRNQDKLQPGVWFLGGAVRIFAPVLDSLVTLLKQETGMSFDPTRFAWIAQNRYFFNGKDKANLPCDSVCELYVLQLTADEIAAIHLDPKEYVSGSLKPFGRKDIANIVDPFVRSILFDLWSKLHS